MSQNNPERFNHKNYNHIYWLLLVVCSQIQNKSVKMESIYICNPGEVVVHLNPERVDSKDGMLATVKGIQSGKVALQAMSSYVSNKNKSLLVKPNALIDSQEAEDDDHDDLSAVEEDDCDSDAGVDDSYSDMDDFEAEEEVGVDNEDSIVGVGSRDDLELLVSGGDTLWQDRIAVGKAQLIAGQRQEAFATFVSTIDTALTKKQKARTMLYAADAARATDQSATVVSLYQDYLLLFPNDANVKAKLAEAFLFTDHLEEAAAFLDTLIKQHPRNLYVWQQVIALQKRQQNQSGVLEALQKCCFECTSPDSIEGVQVYLLMGHSAMQFVATDPWLCIRILIKALNCIKTLGHNITMPQSATTTSAHLNTVSFFQSQAELTIQDIVAEAWYLLGKAFQQLDAHFKKTQRESSCLSSALVAFQCASQFNPNNSFYLKACKDVEKKLQPSK
jgi:tetratricopeptide (TPR) repeat protein